MIKLPPLPFAYDALEPALSKHAVEVHYDKHTRKYYDTVNDLIKGTIFEDATDIESVLNKKTLTTAGSALFNNLAQAWNHAFYWECITPTKEKTHPSASLEKQINQDFESVAQLKKTIAEKANQHFGSGWVWLVEKHGKLLVKTTPNAGTPIATGEHPLFAIDLWEHAWLYDPQYAANKTAYVTAILNILNWKFINDNFDEAGH